MHAQCGWQVSRAKNPVRGGPCQLERKYEEQKAAAHQLRSLVYPRQPQSEAAHHIRKGEIQARTTIGYQTIHKASDFIL